MSSALARKASNPELRGRDVLLGMLVFFGVVFVVNGYLLFAALSTHAGVVAVEPYRKGLAYNDRIAADERQGKLGWQAGLEVEPSGRVGLSLTDRDGRPVTGVSVVGSIGRPATNRSDRSLTVNEIEPGKYAANSGFLAPGSWIVSLEMSDGAAGSAPTYRLRRRIWLKP